MTPTKLREEAEKVAADINEAHGIGIESAIESFAQRIYEAGWNDGITEVQDMDFAKRNTMNL